MFRRCLPLYHPNNISADSGKSFSLVLVLTLNPAVTSPHTLLRYALWLYFIMVPHKQSLLSQLQDKDPKKQVGATTGTRWWGGD
jgi:hypothetical protein